MFGQLILLTVLTSSQFAMVQDQDSETRADVQAIGGRWYLKTALPGEKPVYLFKDGDRWADLFSYHTRDSNKDGIDNIRLRHDHNFLIVESQGYPNHPTAIFPNSDNPNPIRVQHFTFRLPLEPKLAGKITRLPMGPVGVAFDGFPVYGPYESDGTQAMELTGTMALDACGGHEDRTRGYHYHVTPNRFPYILGGYAGVE